MELPLGVELPSVSYAIAWSNILKSVLTDIMRHNTILTPTMGQLYATGSGISQQNPNDEESVAVWMKAADVATMKHCDTVVACDKLASRCLL